MSKYLFQASYTQAGVQGLLKEGGSGRREALTQTVEGLGGSLDAMYYAFGDVDLLMVVDLPDEASAVALSMFIGAAGALDVTMKVLVSPETIDEAIRKNVSYRAPGD
ncbi:MAG: GYD domain-containing protein [Gammaproteobacteria bacterium]|nr:GYD domain-containing protein [Gammaproteobacteria bacterium]